MTPVAGSRRGLAAAPPSLGRAAARPAQIACLLFLAVGARWAASVGAAADALLVGALFGVALVGVAVASGWRPAWRPVPVAQLAVGMAGGLALVALALLTRRAGPQIAIDPASSLAPWAAVTVLVAVGEEAILRGVLFDAAEEAGGVVAALAVTSVAFALLHVPLYGWHVVPLDLGVGLFLGGLRVLGGGVAAPATAHAVADLATWWM